MTLIFDYDCETEIRKCFDNRHVALFFFNKFVCEITYIWLILDLAWETCWWDEGDPTGTVKGVSEGCQGRQGQSGPQQVSLAGQSRTSAQKDNQCTWKISIEKRDM